MICNNRINDLYAWLDGELGQEKAAAMEEHLQICPRCREEYTLWQEVRQALRCESAEIAAPPGLTAEVMSRIGHAEKSRLVFFPVAWKRGIAAAAASLLIACGSYGAAMYSGLLNGARVADNNTGHTITDSVENVGTTLPFGSGQAPETVEPKGQEISSGAETGNQTSTARPEKNTGNNESGAVRGTANTGNSEGNTESSGSAQMVALLNTDKKRVIHSTLLRVSVEELRKAENSLAVIAGRYAADQGNKETLITAEGNRGVFELMVPLDKVEPLLAELASIGRVTAKDGSEKDISGQYNQQVERYQSLQAQLMGAGNPEEKKAIEAEMNNIASQLSAWEKEVGIHRVVVWLEN